MVLTNEQLREIAQQTQNGYIEYTAEIWENVETGDWLAAPDPDPDTSNDEWRYVGTAQDVVLMVSGIEE